MSTRATIGYTTDWKTARVTYCYADGYPAYTGMLLTGYPDAKSVSQLVNGGHMSHMGLYRMYADTKSERLQYSAVLYKSRNEVDSACEIDLTKQTRLGDSDYSYMYSVTDGHWYVVGVSDEWEDMWKIQVQGAIKSKKLCDNKYLPMLAELKRDCVAVRPQLQKANPNAALELDTRLQRILTQYHKIYETVRFPEIKQTEFIRGSKIKGLTRADKVSIKSINKAGGFCVIQRTDGSTETQNLRKMIEYTALRLPGYIVSNPSVVDFETVYKGV